jgi:magnesium-protoporphyrin O-methyltransferase
MESCRCAGVEEEFGARSARDRLASYRRAGPADTTRRLAALLAPLPRGGTLLDIGGGVGAASHLLLEAGLDRGTLVDASAPLTRAAREEADRRGLADRLDVRHGDLLDLAPDLASADIVTLDRVICCDPEPLVLLDPATGLARSTVGLVYPRPAWWVAAGLALENLSLAVRRSTFRAHMIDCGAVARLMAGHGFRLAAVESTLVWRLEAWRREG